MWYEFLSFGVDVVLERCFLEANLSGYWWRSDVVAPTECKLRSQLGVSSVAVPSLLGNSLHRFLDLARIRDKEACNQSDTR